MISISVIIRTKNEAARLPACLASLGGAFDDVFVVDSNSADGTAAIARAGGARVVDFAWNGAYPKKSQWCLTHVPARYDWVLFLDADERMTSELISELRALNFSKNAYWVSADPVWHGVRLRHGQHNHKICLMHRARRAFPVADDLDTPMGEVEGHYQPIIDGAAGRLAARMTHDCDPLPEWFHRHVRYAEVAAAMHARRLGEHETGWRGLCKRLLKRLPFQGTLIFLYGYVWQRGFLDGRAGLDYALARAWYYELSALFRHSRRRSAP